VDPSGSERTVSRVAAYFPDALSPDHASPIAVEAGSEIGTVALQYRFVETARVEGRVALPAERAPMSTSGIHLASEAGGPDRDRYPRPVVRNGRFTLTDIPAGIHTVTAWYRRLERDGRAHVALWGRREFVTNGRDDVEIAVDLQPGVTVFGRIVLDGEPPPTGAARFTPFLRDHPLRANSAIDQMRPSTTNDGDRFAIFGVPPGHYQLRFHSPNAEWQPTSVVVEGREAIDTGFEVTSLQPPPEHDLIVTLTNRRWTISGLVRDSTGADIPDALVVVFPADPALRDGASSRIVAIEPDSDGHYVLSGVLPGEYLLAATAALPPISGIDAAWLERHVPAGTRITLTPGSELSATLTIGSRR
jgi:hypothetical protein